MIFKIPIPGNQNFSFQNNNLEDFCTVKYAYINIFLQCKRVLLSQNIFFLASGNQSFKPVSGQTCGGAIMVLDVCHTGGENLLLAESTDRL
jgi:hypothetical protein